MKIKKYMSVNENKINKKDKINIVQFRNKYYIIKNGKNCFEILFLK